MSFYVKEIALSPRRAPGNDPCEVPLEASHRVVLGLAGSSLTREVVATTRVTAALGQCHWVDRAIQPAVAAAIQPPAVRAT